MPRCEGWLEDIAAFTGATVYNPAHHPEFLSEFFGSALEVLLNYKEFIITPYDDHINRASERSDIVPVCLTPASCMRPANANRF